jgi:hypothetical protein
MQRRRDGGRLWPRAGLARSIACVVVSPWSALPLPLQGRPLKTEEWIRRDEVNPKPDWCGSPCCWSSSKWKLT